MIQLTDNMNTYRQDLHKIPELGLQEHKTHDYLMKKLTEFGYEPQTVFNTGVYVFIKGSEDSDETFAFRSDMDALSITDDTNCEYTSTHEGLMHACGHDGHMAILLGYLEFLKDKKIKKNVLAVFQPAEESPGGAKYVIESGIFEKYNVKSIFGLHLFPNLAEGIIGCRPNSLMAKAAELNIIIKGKGGHGGQPHQGIDSIQVATKVLDGLNLITSKYVSPFETAVIAFGKISGGTIRNIIAKETRLEGTIRALTSETFNFVVKKIHDITHGLEIAYDVKIEVEIADGYPPVINDKEYTAVLESGVNKVEGLEYVEVNPEMLAEDFGFYQEAIRGVFFFLGTGNKELGFNYSLHSSKFNFSKQVLQNGLKAYKAVAEELEII